MGASKSGQPDISLYDLNKADVHQVNSRQDFKEENLRELSQPQERFAPKLKRNQEKIFIYF